MIYFLLPLLLLLAAFSPARAEPPALPMDSLSQEQLQTLQRAQSELQAQQQALPERLAALAELGKIDPQVLDQAQLNLQTARLQAENLQLEYTGIIQDIAEKQRAIVVLEQQARELKGQVVAPEKQEEQEQQRLALQDSLGQRRAALEQARQNSVYVLVRLEQAKVKLYLEEEWFRRVQELRLARQEESRRESTQKEQQHYLERAGALQAKLENLQNSTDASAGWERHLLTIQAQDAEERARLATRELRLADSQAQLESLQSWRQIGAELAAYPNMLDTAGKLQQEQEGMRKLLSDKLKLLRQQQSIGLDRQGQVPANARKFYQQEQEVLGGLIAALERQQELAAGLSRQVEAFHSSLQQEYSEKTQVRLSKRRDLPQTLDGWHGLATEALSLPATVWRHLGQLGKAAGEELQEANQLRWIGAAAVGALWIGVLLWRRQVLRQRIDALLRMKLTTPNFSAYSLLLTLRVTQANLWSLGLAGLLALLAWLTQLASAVMVLMLLLLLLWLAIRLPISVAYFLLDGPDVSASYRDPRLYRQLRWALVLLGLFSSLTLLVHWLPFSAQLRDANDSIFMLFLCLLTVPAINLRRMALARLENQVRNRYWLLAGQLASLLFPLGILVAGGLGLIGYINLAWTVARSLTWLVAVLAGWLVARGLLSDAVAWLKPYAMQHSARYGLLWTQDIIPLLHKLAKLGLLTLAALFLFKLNGWHTDSDFMRDILAYALFEIGQAEVTVQALLLSLFAVWIVGWLGKWSRQITYRWILSGIADLGVRHSLSVFTQYTVVLIGGVIVLRIIGLDLTTFTVFAGALGVGIGFGLQNITNNFISGLLLLIERPLRNGDLVELGNAKHGGEVTRIGIRSLTIKTWDNKEVIIPNSELISSAFTSWTHSDNILREELYLGVSYESDPAKVENILNRILADHPGVLKTPEPKVYFWEFADSALTFRYQYFVNLRETDRHEVKSSVLHHIWNDFKQAGVEIPFPQREVMVKASPELLGLLAAAKRA